MITQKVTQSKTSAVIDLTSVNVADRTVTFDFLTAWQISTVQILFSTAEPRTFTIYTSNSLGDFVEIKETGIVDLTYQYSTLSDWFGTSDDNVKIIFDRVTTGAITAQTKIIYRDS